MNDLFAKPDRPRPPGTTPDITIDDMIKCARREIGFRTRVYPGWVAKGRMKQADADREIATMCEILRIIEDLRRAGVVGNGPRT